MNAKEQGPVIRQAVLEKNPFPKRVGNVEVQAISQPVMGTRQVRVVVGFDEQMGTFVAEANKNAGDTTETQHIPFEEGVIYYQSETFNPRELSTVLSHGASEHITKLPERGDPDSPVIKRASSFATKEGERIEAHMRARLKKKDASPVTHELDDLPF